LPTAGKHAGNAVAIAFSTGKQARNTVANIFANGKYARNAVAPPSLLSEPEFTEFREFSGFEFTTSKTRRNMMKKVIILLALVSTVVFAQQKGTFTDPRDGKTYKTVKIGEQTWMAENLNYVAKGSKCGGTNQKIVQDPEYGYEYKVYVLTDDNTVNCDKYGRLYEQETAMKACPVGWHLPSDAEWQTLLDVAGGYEIAGKKLKARSSWDSYEGKSGNGTDIYGFSALPGSYGEINGGFSKSVGSLGFWWTAEDSWYMSSYSDNVRRAGDHISVYPNLCSVRCLKD
jgi:uncharacterized protein (TIGR02145 family)